MTRRRATTTMAVLTVGVLAVAVLAGCASASGGDAAMVRAGPGFGRGGAATAEAVAPSAAGTPGTTPAVVGAGPAGATPSEAAPFSAPPDTAAPTPTPTPGEPATTVTEAPPPEPAPSPAATGRFTIDAYRGLGTWLDVYDWSATFTGGNPPAGIGDIDRMADLGVQTLYLQASKWDSPTDILEPERLMPLIDRAHARGMRVVAWYLPTFEDPSADLRRLLAVAALPVDGLGVDIESRVVTDVAERNHRLVDLSIALRQALPSEVLSAIVLPPVVMEDINPAYWPGHPWAELGPLYDVWQPMNYWTNRTEASGYRDAYTYTAENIDRVRDRIGQPDAVVHPVGGIGDATTAADVEAMLGAASERGAIGGSLYDYRTTHEALWSPLQAFRN